MNIQPIIDNIPAILVSIGFCLWAWARLTEAKAKANPAIDEWDSRADRAAWASRQYAQAIDWLVAVGAERWSGAEKLAQLTARVKGFEEQWTAGNYLEALANVTGFYQAAKSKVEKVAGVTLPFGIRPSPRTSQPQSQAAEIGPDSPATENTDGE